MELRRTLARVAFAALCREFLAEEYEAAPVLASGLGLAEFDGRLDDLSAGAFEERRRRSGAWRERFRAVPDAGLGPGERIDRDLVVSVLSGRVIMAEWEACSSTACAPTPRSSATRSRASGRFPRRWSKGGATWSPSWSPPTQASAYLVGCLEILGIRGRYIAHPGDGTPPLRDFHDRLAGSGGLPPALAERALLTDR